MTKTDWTAEEVRTNLCAVERVRNNIHSTYKSLPEEWHDWALEQVAELTCAVDFRNTLTAFANRIEADESAMPVGKISGGVEVIRQFAEPVYRMQIIILADGVEQLPGGTNVFTRPPAQEQPGWKVPDGWRLVPIKATEKMRQEGAPHAGYEEEEAYSLDAVWAAMLAASPTPPKEN